MAKQRLVDFRGGINQKISPHMIGDSQGQDGSDLDVSAVRLQGRFETDRLSANRAYGSFWYDSGVSTGRWVSKFQEDDSGTPNEPYIQYATDFAVWNRDLYVSLAGAGSTGTLQIFRDGSSTPTAVAFDPPDAVTVEVDIENNSDTALIGAISSQSASTQTVVVDVAGVNSNAAEFNYSQTGTSPQQPYLTNVYETWQKTGDTTVYYRYSGDSLYTRSTVNTGNITVTIGDATKFNPYYYQDSGNHQEDGRYRWYKNGSSTEEYWANGTSSTTPLTTRSSSQSTAVNVTTTNYNTLPWFDNSTYTRVGTTHTINAQSYTKYQQNGTLDLYALNDSGTLKALGSGTSTVVTTANYQSYSWGNGDTYNQDPANATFAYNGNTYYKWFRNIAGNTGNTQELWALGNSGNLLERTSSGTTSSNLTSNSTWPSSFNIRWLITTVYVNQQPSSYEVQVRYNSYQPAIQTFSTKSAAEAVTSVSGTTTQGESFTLNRGALISTGSQTGNNSDSYYVSGTVSTPTYSFSNHSNTTQGLSDHTNTYHIYSYQNHTDSYFYYAYSGPKTEQRQVAYVPATPAYYYDDARSKLYIVKVTDADVGDSSPAFSNGWLEQGRDFSLSGSGYYFRTVREVSGQYIPSLSQTYRLANLATNNSYIFGGNHSGGDYVHTPQRLTFNITAPTDSPGDPLACYRLERRDSRTTSSSAADLCYFVPTSYDPTTGVPNFFNYNATSKQISLSNLDSTKTYTVSWVAYQDTKVSINGSTSSSVSGSYEFAGNASPAPYFTLIDGADQRYLAADFRLSVRVIEPHPTNSTLTGTFALTRCFDVFDLKTQDGNGVDLYLSGECDFLEGWPNGLGCGGLDSSGAQSGVPDHLKFIEESNNFFFGVGTADTSTSYYGGGDNKAGSFLFVSDYNNPRNWDIGSYVQFDEEITGIHSYPGELIVWTKNATYRVFGSRPNEMRKIKLATTEGLLPNEERSIALVGNYLVWVSQSGICFYDGSKVTNLTRGRFEDLDILNAGANIHASQFSDRYYVINGVTEKGYVVDFSLPGFPITRIDLNEDGTAKPTNSLSGTTYTPPSVLIYKSSENKLYSRRGIIEGNTGQRLPFTYKTRAFDGGAFGTLKLIRSVTINGNGNGNIRIYLDGREISRDLSDFIIDGEPYFTQTAPNVGYWTAPPYTQLQEGLSVSSSTTTFRVNGSTAYSSVTATSEIIPGGVWENPSTGVVYEINSVATVSYGGISYYSYKTISYDFPVTITSGLESEPKRVFLPASRTNAYGLPMADTWWVEVRDWNGIVDWIDTDYEIVAT